MEVEETTTVETGAVVTAVETAGLALELPSSADILGRGDDSERKGSIQMDKKAGNGCRAMCLQLLLRMRIALVGVAVHAPPSIFVD
jgi:hypothetical protein